MSANYERDSYVWLPDAQECFLPGKVKISFHAGESTKILTEDGEVSSVYEQK